MARDPHAGVCETRTGDKRCGLQDSHEGSVVSGRRHPPAPHWPAGHSHSALPIRPRSPARPPSVPALPDASVGFHTSIPESQNGLVEIDATIPQFQNDLVETDAANPEIQNASVGFDMTIPEIQNGSVGFDMTIRESQNARVETHAAIGVSGMLPSVSTRPFWKAGMLPSVSMRPPGGPECPRRNRCAHSRKPECPYGNRYDHSAIPEWPRRNRCAHSGRAGRRRHFRNRLIYNIKGRSMSGALGGASVRASRTSDAPLAPARQEPRPTQSGFDATGGASVPASLLEPRPAACRPPSPRFFRPRRRNQKTTTKETNYAS